MYELKRSNPLIGMTGRYLGWNHRKYFGKILGLGVVNTWVGITVNTSVDTWVGMTGNTWGGITGNTSVDTCRPISRVSHRFRTFPKNKGRFTDILTGMIGDLYLIDWDTIVMYIY